MKRFLQLPKEERYHIIEEVAMNLKVNSAIVEKDFWVCWVLYYLFHDFEYKDFICFKGGTCLSKVFHCIERFSEDIDLALDWSALNLSKDEAYLKKSNTQQDNFNKRVNEKTGVFIKNTLLPLLQNEFRFRLNENFNLYIEEHDPQTICFQYPRSFEDVSILQIIRLEIGALAEPVPSSSGVMCSYITEVYPTLFDHVNFDVQAVDIVRTFFEKLTILHREANRTNGHFPKRYSRHFYDVYQMIQCGIAGKSLEHLEIMGMVVRFKKKFYPCKWAEYDEVLRGNCKLIPSKEALLVFMEDYEAMKNMIYGNYPSFIEIIATLESFEVLLNQLLKISTLYFNK